MADLYEPDVGTAYYRSSDPVKNLKISVKLDRITSTSLVPNAAVKAAPAIVGAGDTPSKASGEEMEMKEMNKTPNGTMKDKEEVVISWQQKIFSQRELTRYRNDDGTLGSPVDRKYHTEVMEILNKERPKNRIFTYVDHDAFSQNDEATEYLTTSPKEGPSFLTQKIAHVRKRRIGAGNKQKRERDHSFVPKLNIIEDDPTEELIQKNHLGTAPIQVMHIMADLSGGNSEATEEDEVVLCTIQVNSDGVLSIHPDFNRGRKAYVKESQKQFGKEVFEYTVEHSSKEMNRQEQDREMKMFREVYSRHKDFLQACVGGDFDMPRPDVLRMLVYGEIESARNFEYDDLYLHFFVDLPKYWTVERSQPMSWITQTCSTKVVGRDDVAYFSFPFNFEVFYHNDNLDADEKGMLT
ncbi:hypothetical protein DPMN_018394 [Dreissena polymorpha]|uniref:Uncharacterized protein n=1 Tax=Dreissena polymorpha TaxID=45954 RepID=A0A9D4NJ96_DREPO|nr:hypothetical protein DPMN_018394 [Dreissena polymorpha]